MKRHPQLIALIVLGLLATPLHAGLVAHFPFDGDTLDASGNGNHGTFHGVLIYTQGHDGTPGGAISLNGIDDHIAITRNSGFPIMTNDTWTVSGWAKGRDGQVDRRLFSEADPTGQGLVTIGTHNNGANGAIDFFYRDDNNVTNLAHAKSQGGVFDTLWHEFAIVYDTGTLFFYLDGSLEAVSYDFTPGPASLSNATIGGIVRAGPEFLIEAELDDIRLFDHNIFAGANTTEHGTVRVTQNDGNNTSSSVGLTLGAGSSFGASLDRGRSSRGDFVLDLPAADDVAAGVVISSVAQNGRDNDGQGDTGGTFYATSSIEITSGSTGTEYFIAVSKAPSGSEGNIDCAFGWFPYDTWLAGLALNDSNGGPITTLDASPGITLDTGSGGAFADPDNNGIYTLDLRGLGVESGDGVLLVNGGKNEDNFALSAAEDDGTFTIYNHDNGENGGNYEPDPVAFVYLDSCDLGKGGLVALGRVNNDASTDVTAGDFSITKAGTGEWHLSIAGQTPSTGTLLISPEIGNPDGPGAGPNNRDNMISYQWDNDAGHWVVQSRDINGTTAPNLQNGGSDAEDMFSFAFFARPAFVVDQVEDEDDVTGIGDTSLREAIRDAPAGSLITFDPTVFDGEPADTIVLTEGELVIDKSLVISAAGLSAPVTIDADGEVTGHRVIDVTGSDSVVALNHLVITGGRTPDPPDGGGASTSGGGGIRNRGHLTLCEVRVSGNATGVGGYGIGAFGGGGGGNGGGIYSSGGTLTLRSSTVSGNATGDGGDADISGGFGGDGGGIYSSGGTLTLRSSTVSGNATGGGGDGGSDGGNGGLGGGIYIDGSLTLSDSTVSGNTTGDGGSASGVGGDGGGIFGHLGNFILRHSTVAGNATGEGRGSGRGGNGGGMNVDEAECSLIGSTITANRAAGSIGGIVAERTNIARHNTIIANNSSASGDPNFAAFTTTITDTGTNLTSGNPRLAPLGDYGGPTQTMPPLPGSPAIDTATGDSSATDQRGFPRSGDADIGATEFQPATDLAQFWPTDWDGDDKPFGIEHATDSDPTVPDLGHPGDPTGPLLDNGTATVSFGRNPEATEGTVWRLVRSTDLLDWDEIFRYDGTTATSEPGDPPPTIDVDRIEIQDANRPEPRAFYRLEALFIPEP